jgi:hypothetical protein
MMLELSQQTNGTALRQDDFRRLLLYQSAYDIETDEEIATFVVPAHLTSVARRWRLSQLREMFNWSLNGMWQWTCEWGIDNHGDTVPIPLSQIRSVVDRLALDELPGVTTKPSAPVGDLLNECRMLASMTDSLDGRWELWTGLTEDQLFGLLLNNELSSEGRLAALVVMYLMCLARISDPSLPSEVGSDDWRPVLEGGASRIGMQYALEQLRRDDQIGTSVAGFAWRLLNDQVIAQHERVALAKLPDDTFRFRRDAKRVRFFDQPIEFQRNDSRFNSLATTCAELGWTGFLSDPTHSLTPEGEIIRRHGDLER